MATVEIYYCNLYNQNCFPLSLQLLTKKQLRKGDVILGETHYRVLVLQGEGEGLNNGPDDGDVMYLARLFQKFNSHANPLCTDENQRLIADRKLHTSMSVGDVVSILPTPKEGERGTDDVVDVKPRHYICAPFGWKRLGKSQEDRNDSSLYIISPLL